MKLFNFKTEKIRGYVYSASEDDERFRNTQVGDLIINKDKKPPWIIVYHSLDTVIITKWPGKLFEVEVLNQSNEKSLNKGLIKNVWYARTLGVKILRKLSVDILFGQNGTLISQIIDRTRNITEQEVTSLAEIEANEAREIFSKAWGNWIALTNKDCPYLGEGHCDTLKVTPKNQSYGSPINKGLSVIASQINIRAREILGDKAFTEDERGELNLIPVWAKACERLLHAGMSYESDGLLSKSEKEILSLPYKKVFEKF